MTNQHDDNEASPGQPLPLTPFACGIHEAVQFSGLSRSEIYRQLTRGDIHAIKSGTRTLILVESLRAHLSGLPKAIFRSTRIER